MYLGLLITRLAVGLLMAAHGAQKLFGLFGGYGLSGTAGFLETLGFRPGRLFAAAAGISESAGGILMALGLFGPVGPALVVSVMVVAALSVHRQNGMFAAANGMELPLLYGVAGATLALTGPGAFSIDELTGLLPLWTPVINGAILAIAILGALANLAARRSSPPVQHAAAA